MPALLFIVAPLTAVADYSRGKAAYDAWDMSRAVELLSLSAEPDPRSAKLLASIYGSGYAGSPNARGARRRAALEMAVRKGDLEAKGLLGVLELHGEFRPGMPTAKGDPAAALPLLREACEGGHVQYCEQVVYLYAGDAPHSSYPTLPADQVNFAEARRFVDLWRKAAFSEKRPIFVIGALQSMSRLAGKAWSGVSLEEGAAFMVAASIYFDNDGQLMQLDPWAKPFETLSHEQKLTARYQADKLVHELGLRTHVAEPADRMARRLAAELAQDERLSRDGAGQMARYMAALGYQYSSPRLGGAGNADAAFESLARDLRPVVDEYLAQVERIQKEKGLDREIFLATALAQKLKPEHLDALLKFYSSGTGRKYQEFRRRLTSVMMESAAIGFRVSYGPMPGLTQRGPQRLLEYAKGRGIQLESDPSDQAARARNEFVRDEAFRLARVRSFGAMMVVSAGLPLAGEPYQRMARILSPSELNDVRSIKFSAAWRALQQVESSLEEKRAAEPGLKLAANRLALLSDAAYKGESLSRARQDAERPHRFVTPGEFATRVYELSAFAETAETLRELLRAETVLIANRWLADRIQGRQERVPAKAPGGWQVMASQLQQAIDPIAARHFAERESLLGRDRLGGRNAFIGELERVIRSTRNRGVQFSDGRGSRESGLDQDIPEILAFHETRAAIKWRKFWPEMRACAARLVALHAQLNADPELQRQGRSPADRAAWLAKRVGGGTLGSEDWRAMRTGRLGLTLEGMHRFPLPLGTLLVPGVVLEHDKRMNHTADDKIVISYVSANGLEFRMMDAQCEKAVRTRPSASEAEQIDTALTAVYDKKKDRWYAALEAEWDAFMSLNRRIQKHAGFQKISRAFADEAAAAMEERWKTWQ